MSRQLQHIYTHPIQF